MKTSAVFRVNGVRVGVIGSTVRNTPELVRASATAGLEFLDEAERIRSESAKLRSQGVNVQVVVIHEGATAGANRIDGTAGSAWAGPIMGIVGKLQDTTVDLVIAGHTHRITNTVVGRIPVIEGVNAGGSYSVAQLLVKGSDVAWAGGTTRVAKNLGVASRPDVQAIVDKANADTAGLRNEVIGRQSIDILRDDPARLKESAMGNLVADAMRAKYPGVDAAITNSGGLRADLLVARALGGEQPGRDHVGRGVRRAAVRQLHGGRDAHRRAARRGVRERLEAAVRRCGGRHRPHAAVLGPEGHVPLQRPRAGGGLDPARHQHDAARAGRDTVRIVTNDFMFTGGDGYTAFAGGTEVEQHPERPAVERADRLHQGQLAGRAGGRRAQGRPLIRRLPRRSA